MKLSYLLLATIPFVLSEPTPSPPCTDCWCVPKTNDDDKCPVDLGKRKTTLEYAADNTITQFLALPDPTNDPPTLKPPGCQPYGAVASLARKLNYVNVGKVKCDTHGTGLRCRKAVCAYKYDSNYNGQCTYTIKTYKNKQRAKKANAVVVHKGKCGVCSTARNVANFLRPDLDVESAKCGIFFAYVPTGPFGDLTFDDAFLMSKNCFMNDIGFDEDCATLWASNAFNTGLFCGKICKQFLENGDPPNDPVTCDLAACLQCDEDYSGRVFRKLGGFTRRRGGVVASFGALRDCDSIANIGQMVPEDCDDD